MASLAEDTSGIPYIILNGDAQGEPPSPNDSVHEAERGRLKRRRMSSHSPPRASSPSRGHDRDSGSRHRHHYRKHRRASSSRPASPLPAPSATKKNRRRSDAEPDHTLRGRARNRSGSRSRSPIFEGEDDEDLIREVRGARKRSQPPSRHRAEGDAEGEDAAAMRRQRSLPNMYRDGKGKFARVDGESGLYEDEKEGIAPAVQRA